MPLDLSGFNSQPNQWAGLYHVSDQLEKRKLRQDQLDLQKQSKRAAAASFLQKYLDPKEYLTGTNNDPMILQGFQAAQQQGFQMVAAGADESTLMTAMSPIVNKLATYSSNAKNVNKQIEDQIKGMQASGEIGYNYAALKDEALKSAFYKPGANGQLQLDPDNFDPNINYVQKAIQEKPLEVTNTDVFDEFAKKAEKFTKSGDVTTYTPTGTTFRSKANLISPAYMVPETVYDAKAKETVTTGFVPKHDIATEQGNPLFHTFLKDGKEVSEPVRLLDEQEFDQGLKSAMQHRIRGMVQEHIKEYHDKTGKVIDIDSPQAKLVGRAIGYDLLNVASRNGGSIQHLENQGKPSSAQINLNIQSTDKYIQSREDIAAANKRGRVSVLTPEEEKKQYQRNVGQVLGDVFTGTEDISGNSKVKLNGTVFGSDGKGKAVKDYQVVDILSSMPGGSLKAGSGVNYDYKGVYYRPENRSIVVAKEVSNPNNTKKTNYEEIPEAQVGQFINKIAEANGIPKAQVKALLEKIGYKNGKFVSRSPTPATPAVNPAEPIDDAAQDFKDRKAKGKSWRDASKNATDSLKSHFGKSK